MYDLNQMAYAHKFDCTFILPTTILTPPISPSIELRSRFGVQYVHMVINYIAYNSCTI